jgi:Divergent InlB B-repeat domain
MRRWMFSLCLAAALVGSAGTAWAAPGSSADAQSVFRQWTGPCSGTQPVSTLSTVTSPDRNCRVSLPPPPDEQLSIEYSGTGLGTVTSSPSGVNCPANCSASFQQGTVVTLSASPADGVTFAGWLGPCSGTGACTLTLNGPTTVTAAFYGYDPGGPPT